MKVRLFIVDRANPSSTAARMEIKSDHFTMGCAKVGFSLSYIDVAIKFNNNNVKKIDTKCELIMQKGKMIFTKQGFAIVIH